MLHVKGLEVYITIQAEMLFLPCAGAAAAVRGCRFDDGKAAASRRTPKVSALGPAVETHWREKRGLEFAVAGNKKSGREAAAIGKNPHFYPEGRVPNETLEVKEFLGSFWEVA
jgi:hypothetical protein